MNEPPLVVSEDMCEMLQEDIKYMQNDNKDIGRNKEPVSKSEEDNHSFEEKFVSDLSCNDVEAFFLNLEQRIEILRQYENVKSSRKLAELFYCGRTQINEIIKEKYLILKEYEDFKFRGDKRTRHEKYVDINEAVL
ncbi:hypothetical protein AVEN_117078-1 [Araneus ventricosus]|uniref:Uncharacterized protein n=1 Tax=Araneus ventricosus TaxID=182803 RepID=A0A4Y2RG22_ARAVE|nr:hypothetical protein AVEN_117078-1 [Araneus ventricosus]